MISMPMRSSKRGARHATLLMKRGIYPILFPRVKIKKTKRVL